MSIGANIKNRREQLGMTREEVAEKAHTTVEEVEKFEAGAYDNDLQDLKDLSDILGVSADYILGI